MIYVFFGDDSFSLQEALAEIKKGLGNSELTLSNTTVLDGQRLTVGELASVCGAVPFLAPQRLVVVEGLLSRFEQRPRPVSKDRVLDSETGEGWRVFADYVKAMPPTTTLVLVDGKLRGDNPLLKELPSVVTVREFVAPQRDALKKWIRSKVDRASGSISEAATQLLADYVAGNLWVLASEIEKLCLYAHGRRIEKEDVRQLVSYAREANIFAMVDAMVLGNASLAINLLHQLRQEGATAPHLLYMITRQFRLLLQAKELEQGGPPTAEAWKATGFTPGYAFQKTLQQAKKYSWRRLTAIYRRLLDVDVSIKTGRWEGELALDLLTLELCRVGKV